MTQAVGWEEEGWSAVNGVILSGQGKWLGVSGEILFIDIVRSIRQFCTHTHTHTHTNTKTHLICLHSSLPHLFPFFPSGSVAPHILPHLCLLWLWWKGQGLGHTYCRTAWIRTSTYTDLLHVILVMKISSFFLISYSMAFSYHIKFMGIF